MSRLPDFPFKISYGPDDDRLHKFYLPALERSVEYLRAAGYFSSSSLAIAAAGVARLIANGGSMRLLVGAQLLDEDVRAIQEGESLAGRVEKAMVRALPEELEDRLMQARLEALAWMVGQGLLEIRVVLPRDRDGKPLPASEAEEYYHPKEGVFTDSQGNRLAFSGSSNESKAGWENNYETFHVFTTWDRKEGGQTIHAAPYHVQAVIDRFEELWSGTNEAWIALDIPEAVRRRLLGYRPASAPDHDPLEKGARPKPRPATDQRERLVFRFLKEAPFLLEARRLGVETSAVRPWPHQDRVIDSVLERFPQGFLFADEVGLGKTIEAGLIFRQLVISGRVERALLLVPASLLRQWQEELYEKCALNLPRYEGGRLLDVHGLEVGDGDGLIWNRAQKVLISSQLAKRRDRQDELLSAEPWDFILVDEAHHARRKDFREERFRPNRLLELLLGHSGRPGLRDKTRCIYLLTATPMQIHPVEVWDLLKILGLGGRWGALQENFLRFFNELRKPFDERDWDFLLDMTEDYLSTGGEIDPDFAQLASERLGPVEWDILKNLPHSRKRSVAIRQLSTEAKGFLEQMVRHHTPVQDLVWRNTRQLLRKYREKGLLTDKIPTRDPVVPRWIPMKKDEWDLYQRIEEYISDFYQKYESERKGLGFVMTVYRRRLTSSFYAVRKSLERRLDYLKGLAVPHGGLTDEDLEEDELDLDVLENLSEANRERFAAEIQYVEDFLRDLRMLSADSKLEQLKKELGEIFHHRETVIVFTQYTDTMNYLRDELRQVYGSHVACYSGDGGAIWDGAAWVGRSKEVIKEEFRKGEEIKLLLCTESASEGLNLQTCGVLINFDMPWNPMRVEQRIGRIDRIGQRYDEVWVFNYFYEETVEATIYQRLSDRIDWFENVVGELQPILHRVSRAIQAVAMLPSTQKQKQLETEIAEIRRELGERQTRSLDLDDLAEGKLEAVKPSSGPLNLEDLEQRLTTSQALGDRFTPLPETEGAYELDWGGHKTLVTFRPEVYDRHPYTLQFLTYGNRLFHELLDSVEQPETSDDPKGVGLLYTQDGAPLSVFVGKDSDQVERISRLTEYETFIDRTDSKWTARDCQEANRVFEVAKAELSGPMHEVLADRLEGERRAILEEARQILIRSALIRRALAEQADLFSGELAGARDAPVSALAELGVPYRGLLAILEGEELVASPTEPFYLEVQGKPEPVLRGRWEALKRQGIAVLESFKALSKPDTWNMQGPPSSARELWLATARSSDGKEE